MAEGFARHYGGDAVQVKSGGTFPANAVSRLAAEVMRERGVDISDQYPKPVDLDFADRADVIITMGCSAEEACPARLFPKIRDWPIEDPMGSGIEEYRSTRDDIEGRVVRLLKELGAHRGRER
jgi:arsenate reductase